MGLNIVESFIVAAAVDVLKDFPSIADLDDTAFTPTHAKVHASMVVVVRGLRKAGCRYHPGLLQSWGPEYEALAGVRFLIARAESWV